MNDTAPLAHAVRTGHLVFVSCIPPFGPDRKAARGDFATQARQCLTNVRHILQEAGSGLEHVVKVNIFLDTRDDFEELNAITGSSSGMSRRSDQRGRRWRRGCRGRSFFVGGGVCGGGGVTPSASRPAD